MPDEVIRGRTFWDVIFEGRRGILKVIGIISAAAFAIWFLRERPAGAYEFVEEYWPILISPIAGYFLGRYVVRTLYRPVRRLLIVMDVATHTLRPILIPEEVFKGMQQSGNNVVYHSAYGTPVYIASDVDFVTGRIDYGWIHELNALTVMTNEEAYVRWNGTLNEVLEENLQLMHNPQVIGLGYARDSLRHHLDDFSETLGFKKVDLEAHDVEGDPEPAEEEASDGQ